MQKRKFVFTAAFVIIFCCSASVSYTHLDVYKRQVQDGMDKLMDNRTTLVIAHRLSTIKNSDCIMVLDHGRIIERGNHESLMKEKGKYDQLYTGMIEMD